MFFNDTPKKYPNFLLLQPLLEKYRPPRSERTKRKEHEAVAEAQRILEYLNLILCRIEYVAEPSKNIFAMNRAEKLIQNPTSICLDTISFYYMAFRLRTLLKEQLGIPVKAERIVIIRNVLLEHATERHTDEERGVYCFGLGGKNGPVIRPLRHAGATYETPPDEGLLINSQKYFDILKTAMSQDSSKN